MTKKRHIHKYSRAKIGKNGDYIIMRCFLPDCSHYVPEKLAVGKATICFGCEEEFVLGINDLKLKPACYGCLTKNKPVENQDEIDVIKAALDL